MDIIKNAGSIRPDMETRILANDAISTLNKCIIIIIIYII